MRRLLGSAVVIAFVAACGTSASNGSEGAPAGESSSSSGSTSSSGAVDPPSDAGGIPSPEAAPAAKADAGPAWVAGQPFAIEGYGASTKGGFVPGHAVVHVTTLADDGPGSLRAALAGPPGARVVLFDLGGAIDLATPLLVPSNVTIDGRGHDIAIRKKGFVLGGSDEVIFTNLAIADVGPNSEDGIQIGSPTDPAEHVVIDHVTFRQSGSGGDSKNVDEAISVVFGSRFITIAWCRFESWEKVMLFGNGDAPAAIDGEIRATVHHTYARATGRRHPQARFGIYDFYDNEWDDWRMYGWVWESPYRESFGTQAQDGARILFENNIARRAVHGFDTLSQANDVTRCESGGIIDERGTWIPSDSTAPLVRGVGCPLVITPLVRPYAATVEPADPKLRAKLESATGHVLR